MSWIPPLLVAVPLLAAAVVVATDHVLPRRVEDLLAIGAAATTCALGFVLMLRSERGDVIHWFGGWHPRGGVAIGIDFAVGPLSAGLACLAAVLVTAKLIAPCSVPSSPTLKPASAYAATPISSNQTNMLKRSPLKAKPFIPPQKTSIRTRNSRGASSM